MLDVSKDLVAVVDTSGRISFINQAASSGLGVEAESIVDRQPFDGTHRDDKAACLAALARAGEEADSVDVEHRVRRGDGKWIVMHTFIRSSRCSPRPKRSERFPYRSGVSPLPIPLHDFVNVVNAEGCSDLLINHPCALSQWSDRRKLSVRQVSTPSAQTLIPRL